MKVKNLIVGCGISGAVMAERLATILQEEVLIIDKRSHIGGNCYDYSIDNISIHKYGPHIFHTNNESVWNYLSHFTSWHIYMHEVLAVIEGQKISIPFNIDSIYAAFPLSIAENMITSLVKEFGYSKKIPILELAQSSNHDLKLLADYVYEHVFLHYTTKQWGAAPNMVDGAVTARVPINISKDKRYFQDKFQGIPENGYTRLIQNIIDNPRIKIMLNTDYQEINANIQYERLFYTGSIDEYYDYKYGTLPYRSVNFIIEKINKQYYQPKAVVNYPNNFEFTRITEFKYFLDEVSPVTYIMKEFPGEYIYKKNEPYYAITNSNSKELYERYLSDAQKEKKVWFLGRLGDYKYYDMDDAVDRALSIFDTINKSEEIKHD